MRDLMGLTRGLVSVWPTILTFLACALATLGVWLLAEAYPRSERSRTLLAVANGLRQVIEVRIDDHLRGLQLAAETWPRFPVRDETEWKATAQMFLQQHPGVVMLALVADPLVERDEVADPDATGAPSATDANGSPTGTSAPPADATAEPDGLAPTDSATPEHVRTFFHDDAEGAPVAALITRHPDVNAWRVGPALSEQLDAARVLALSELRPSIDGPFQADSGQRFYQVVIPLPGSEQQPGMLYALLQPGVVLAALISEAAPGYWLSIQDGDTTIYSQGTPLRPRSENAPDETQRAELPVRLLMGETWGLELALSDAFAIPPALNAGAIVLATGLAFSILLAGVVYLGQVSRVRARALAIANRELRSQIVSTAVAEGRVRQVNESLEARVAERTRALDEVVTELETFNYSVSHDLRSPIGAIVNFTSILEEDYKDTLGEQGLDILRRVGGCAQNAVAMMDGLLTFSHIGQQTLTLGKVEMKPLAEAVFGELMLARTGPAPEFSVGPLPDATADAVMMRTVWTNLLSNAVKFTAGRSEPSIEVGSQPAPDEDVYYVRDNGVGFEMKHATRLFNVFEQLHPTTASKGHGVGLAIVSRIVRRHGGRVWAQAAPDKGATFYFSIPRQAP